jgi:predicted PurR-regulated permease PerM
MTRDLLDRHRSLRLLVLLLVAVVGFYLLNLVWNVFVLFGDVVLLFFLAWIVAFVLDPVSILLQRRHVPRPLAVTLIYTALLVVVSGGIVLTIPSLEEEVRLLASEITSALSGANLESLNANAISTLRHLGFSQQNARNIVDTVSGQVPGWIQTLTNNAVNMTTTLFASILSVLFNAFLVLIVSFYMMLDGGRLTEHMIAKLPPRWIPDVRLFQRYVEQIFGGFFRAQLTIAAIYAALTWLVLLILGQGNLLVALIAGVLLLLPFIGTVLCLVPPVLLVLLQAPSDNLAWNLAVLIVSLVIAQNIVFQIIAPKIFGVHLGVHPLILFGALLIGTKLGGVWGAFFAGPLVAVGYAMLRVYYERFAKTSSLFSPEPLEATKTLDLAATPDTDGEPREAVGTAKATTPSRKPILDKFTLPRPASPRPE